MKLFSNLIFTCCFCITLLLAGCRQDKYETEVTTETGYPKDVDAIITKKCATAGCHNTASRSTAANLDFSTFKHMLEGNNIGATIVPYAPSQSPLLFFTCTDASLGPVLTPNMPFNLEPLSRSEYLTLKNWVTAGSPDDKGIVPFTGDPNRKKFYVVNQGCDLLAVFDSDTRLIMRYRELGLRSGAHDYPHNIKITPDGKYALIPFLAANLVQMFSTETDLLVANISIPISDSGAWNTIVISSDSKWAYAVDNAQGRIAYLNLETRTATCTPGYASQLHGIALNATNDTMFVVENGGYNLWVIPVHDSIQGWDQRDLRTFVPGSSILNMHEIVFSPDHSRYFITCEKPNQVWAFQRTGNPNHDSLVAVFNVPAKPQEIAFSKSTNNVFITCQDAATFSGVTGAVEVINYKTLQHITTLKAGWQPHGIAVDDAKGLVYIINRNADATGAPPHHTTCGRDGWLTTFDLRTLQKLPGDPELSGDPYNVAIRP